MRLIESVVSKAVAANRWQRKFITVVLKQILVVPDKVTFHSLSCYRAYHEKTFSCGFGRAYE